MDLKKLKPTTSVDANVFERRTRAGATPKAENPFLTDGWLAKTWETGKPDMVTGLEGTVSETTTITKGANKGKVANRESYTGEVYDVVRAVRTAANELEIGVTIRVTPDVYKTGSSKGDHNGKWTVHYLAQERRIRRTKEEIVVDGTENDE